MWELNACGSLLAGSFREAPKQRAAEDVGSTAVTDSALQSRCQQGVWVVHNSALQWAFGHMDSRETGAVACGSLMTAFKGVWVGHDGVLQRTLGAARLSMTAPCREIWEGTFTVGLF